MTMELIQDLFQILKRIEHLQWSRSTDQKLKGSEYELLIHLYLTLEGGDTVLTPSDVSDQLGISPGRVTHLLNPLEESGHIERLRSPDDRRVVLIKLTDKGKAEVEPVIQRTYNSLANIVNYLGEEDIKTLIRLMSSLLSYVEEHPTALFLNK
jgi:DNA-binding MarR family transcriptional regulator